MRTPKDLSRWNRFCVFVYAYYDGWIIKILISVFVAAPPATIIALYTNKELKNFIRLVTSDTTYNSIATIGTEYNILFNLLAFLWPLFFTTLGAEIAKKAVSNAVNVDSLFALIRSLDSIVGIKDKRFSSHAKNIANLSKENAFENITDPNAQIAEIVNAIGVYFNAIANNKKTLIRVTLAVMKDEKIYDVPIFYPNDEPIKASNDCLSSPNSAFMNAFKTKKMLLITDIKKELKKSDAERKFAKSENEEDNFGSMICYPVKVYDSSIPFVISIHSDESGYFKDELKEVYEHTLRRFALRLSVENSLLIMKERLCGK